MTGRKARLARREVYGTDHAPSHRTYSLINVKQYRVEIKDEKQKQGFLARGFKFLQDQVNKIQTDTMVFFTTTAVADKRRRLYKAKKRQYARTRWTERHNFFKIERNPYGTLAAN